MFTPKKYISAFCCLWNSSSLLSVASLSSHYEISSIISRGVVSFISTPFLMLRLSLYPWMKAESKSENFNWLLWKRMLSGLRSLWIIPFARSSSSPYAIWHDFSITCSSVKGGLFLAAMSYSCSLREPWFISYSTKPMFLMSFDRRSGIFSDW